MSINLFVHCVKTARDTVAMESEYETVPMAASNGAIYNDLERALTHISKSRQVWR